MLYIQRFVGVRSIFGGLGTSLAAAVLAGLLAPSIASAIVTADTFDVGAVNISVTQAAGSQNSLETGLAGNQVLGGSRSVTVDYLGGPGGSSTTTAKLVSINGDGAMAFSSDTNVAGRLRLLYDANGAGLNADLSEAGGSKGFAVFFDSADSGAETMVTLTDHLGQTLAASGLTTGADSLFFDFSNFIGTGDITRIDSILFEIKGQASGDYTLRLLETNSGATTSAGIPEPITATLGLMSLMPLALAVSRRRR